MDFFVITVIKSFWHAEHNAGAAVIEEQKAIVVPIKA